MACRSSAPPCLTRIADAGLIMAVIAIAGGAPLALLDGVPAPVAISISHAAGRGLCAVAPAGMSVDCDLESVVRRDPAFARDYLTAAEQAWAAEDACRVTRFWSATEAALKAVGEGLREDPRAVEVTPDDSPAGTWAALPLTMVWRRLRGWRRDLEGRVAAVALA